MIVYLITNKINGKRYVGQTIQSVKSRWSKHCSSSSANRGMPIVNAIQKYGKENFEIKILAKCDSIEQINHREAYYIKLLKTQAPNGYNILSGGLNSLHTEETKKKISDAQTGEKNHNFGKKASMETKAKMSVGHMGIRKSEEERRAISDRVTGEKHPMFGKHHTEEAITKISMGLMGRIPANKGLKTSEETKKKISAAQTGKITPLETREKLSVVNSHSDMEVLCHQTNAYYRSTAEVARILGLSRSKVKNVLKGKSKHTKGYTFEYSNKENATKRKFREKVAVFCHQNKKAYLSISEASNSLDVPRSSIYKSIRTRKTTKGYSFEYVR